KSTINGRTTEQVFVGGKGWTRIGTGAWTVMETSLITSMMSLANGTVLGDLTSIITDAKSAGTETLDGHAALVYSYVLDMSKASTPMELKTEAKIWINQATGLIVKNESTGTFSGVTSHTVQTVEYDPSIKIEPPQ
ncbi:MAG TPA: hypothetical protein VGK87_13770, partial [Anaerolineae bacterium]